MIKALQKAPYFKNNKKKDPQDQIIILIGTEAWSCYGNGKGYEWGLIKQAVKAVTPIGDYDVPIVIGEEQLNNINNLQLAKETHSNFRIIQCGT